MKPNESQLKQMFVRATDEVIPPAPWLEGRVVDAVHQRGRVRGVSGLNAVPGLGSGLRLTAGLVGILIAVGAVAALLMSARIPHTPTLPGGRSMTVPSPASTPPYRFTPSPAVRAANWPPGGTVPTQLAGSWQPVSHKPVLHLAEYSWELGNNTAQCGPETCGFGNVVVNGSEIDFIDDACTLKGDFGFERFNYAVIGNTLVLTGAQGPGQSACLWLLAGTYSRVP